MNQGTLSQCRSDRLSRCAFERAKLIRRTCIADLIVATGHMTGSKGRTYYCTVRLGPFPEEDLAIGAVPRVRA